jgi:hypothetical protein
VAGHFELMRLRRLEGITFQGETNHEEQASKEANIGQG